MQSQSSTRIFDMWGEVPRGEHETISYREPQLSELIAASVIAPLPERPSQTKIDVAPPAGLPVESTVVMEPADVDVALEDEEPESVVGAPIESTVVIATSRTVSCSVSLSKSGAVPSVSVPAQSLGRPRVRGQNTSTLSPFVIERPFSSSGSTPSLPSMSYSVADSSVAGVALGQEPEQEPLPIVTRVAYAVSIAVVGVLCGVVGATSLLHVSATGARVAHHAQPRTSVDDRIPVAAIVREKAAVQVSAAGRQHR